MWEVIIPAMASLAGGAMSYFGGQNANNANTAMAQNNMNFQQAQGEAQEIFTREMFDRQSAFNAQQADKAYYRNVDVMNAQNRHAWENRDWNAAWAERQADKQMAFQSDQVLQQQDFQREMAQQAQDFSMQSSSTAYQRAMADMRAAGLNPMLAYQRGGASSPIGVSASGSAAGGAMPSLQTPASAGASAPAASASGGSRSAQSGAMARIENILGPAVQSALQTAGIYQSVQNLKHQGDLLEAQTGNVRADTANVNARTITEGLRPEQLTADTRRTLRQLGLIDAQTGQARASSAQSTAQAELARTETLLLPERTAASVARDRATAGAQQAHESQTRQSSEADRTYGRGGARPVEQISQTLQSIWESLRNSFR